MSRRRIVGRSSLAIAGPKHANDSDPGTTVFSAVRMVLLLAYVDPGSAGFIITTVLGVLAAGGYITRSYLNRLKHWLFRRGRKVELEKAARGTDGQADDR